MKNLRTICLIICLGFISSVGYGQLETSSPMPNEPGKCYAKAFIPSVYTTVHDLLYLYTGSDYDQEGIRMEEIEIQQAGEKWVKKKDPRNGCRSSNQEDCMILCLV